MPALPDAVWGRVLELARAARAAMGRNGPACGAMPRAREAGSDRGSRVRLPAGPRPRRVGTHARAGPGPGGRVAMACPLLATGSTGEGGSRIGRSIRRGPTGSVERETREGGKVSGGAGAGVLAAIDFSLHSAAAAERACELAGVSNASVRLVHALDPPGERADGAFGLREHPQRKLEALRRQCANRGANASAVCEPREPVELILDHAVRHAAGLIVMGRHGYRGPGRIFLGSVAERTIRSAPVPVMTAFDAGPETRSKIRHILFATDFSETSERALEWTLRWAPRLEADVEVLHAVPPAKTAAAEAGLAPPREDPDGRRGALRNRGVDRPQSILARMSRADVPASADLVHGPASIEIAKRAAEIRADLVVMGGGGRSGPGGPGFGSVAARVLRQVRTSVLLVPG
ncbi:MAG TPA: universal stress protein [Deltaproteobacteria bacterium]|nr:universal stress protein [Deltaproteobacteria bacterium]